jgi:hypothetical protein
MFCYYFPLFHTTNIVEPVQYTKLLLSFLGALARVAGIAQRLQVIGVPELTA